MSHILEIQKEPKSWISFFEPTVLELLIHIERLNNLNFSTFHYIQMTDELDVNGEYKGFAFEIYMGNGGATYLIAQSEMPEDLFDEIRTHVNNYKRVSRKDLDASTNRFKNLAKGIS